MLTNSQKTNHVYISVFKLNKNIIIALLRHQASAVVWEISTVTTKQF